MNSTNGRKANPFPKGTKIGITDKNGKEIKVGDNYRCINGQEGVVSYPALDPIRQEYISAFAVYSEKGVFVLVENLGEVI